MVLNGVGQIQRSPCFTYGMCWILEKRVWLNSLKQENSGQNGLKLKKGVPFRHRPLQYNLYCIKKWLFQCYYEIFAHFDTITILINQPFLQQILNRGTVVDLYTEARPRCSVNFLKLCKTKYYNFSTIFNVQRDFVIQCGDPEDKGEPKNGSSVFAQTHGDAAR